MGGQDRKTREKRRRYEKRRTSRSVGELERAERSIDGIVRMYRNRTSLTLCRNGRTQARPVRQVPLLGLFVYCTSLSQARIVVRLPRSGMPLKRLASMVSELDGTEIADEVLIVVCGIVVVRSLQATEHEGFLGGLRGERGFAGLALNRIVRQNEFQDQKEHTSLSRCPLKPYVLLGEP